MKNERKQQILDSLKNGLIVSCQVQKDDPIYTEDMPVKLAEAAVWGGAVAIRANMPEQIKRIREKVQLPIIGLYKKWRGGDDEPYVTTTLADALEVWEAGADIIAFDCTDRLTHERKKAYELLPALQKEIPDAILFADISNYDEAKRAVELGADIVATSLHGYTKATRHWEGPDWREFAAICRDFSDRACIAMEGHIYTPEDAMKCLYLGAHMVVVGSAITRPHLTTRRFVDLLSGYQHNWRDAEVAKH